MYNSNTKESVLKQNDCRYGNYIIYGGSITQLNEKEMCHFFRFPGTYKPIHLTEEWLSKLGYDLISENHYGVLGHLIWKIEDRFYCDKNGIELKNVHQLQNLYFALTQRELTAA